jgi:hypothetical protein
MPKYQPWERPGPAEFIRGWSESLPDAKDTAVLYGVVAASYVVGSVYGRKSVKKKKK